MDLKRKVMLKKDLLNFVDKLQESGLVEVEEV
jgi:hypothetical protein